MAEDNDLERTEQPSQQRLEKAREEGQTVHSQEWITFAMLLAGGAALWFFSADALTGLKTLLRTALTFDGEVAVHAESVIPALNRPALDALWSCLPLFAVLIVAAVAAPVLSTNIALCCTGTSVQCTCMPDGFTQEPIS